MLSQSSPTPTEWGFFYTFYTNLYMNYKLQEPREKELLQVLEKREDNEAIRLKRYLHLPDLSRKEGSPLAEMVRRIKALPTLEGFVDVAIPEVTSVAACFDLFDFPMDHPARSTSDSYYVGEDYLLRPHTTLMWYYLSQHEGLMETLETRGELGVLCHGKVYRKDEIDRQHFNVFHQIDGLYLTEKTEEVSLEVLKEVLSSIAQALLGSGIVYRFNEEHYPYTDPSLEMEIMWQGEWLEVLGGGIMTKEVMKRLGIDHERYHAWAFGFGLERIAMINMSLPDIRLFWSEDERVVEQMRLDHTYEPVSKYPEVVRDVSFVIEKTKALNDIYIMIRDVTGELIEEVVLIDTYENEEKFGIGNISYTMRLVYRSHERTLTREEVDKIQSRVRTGVKEMGGALR